jgi:hypothetical protein
MLLAKSSDGLSGAELITIARNQRSLGSVKGGPLQYDERGLDTQMLK